MPEILREEINELKNLIEKYKEKLTNRKKEFKKHSLGLKTEINEYVKNATNYKEIISKLKTESNPKIDEYIKKNNINLENLINSINISVDTVSKWNTGSDKAKYGKNYENIIHKTKECDEIITFLNNIDYEKLSSDTVKLKKLEEYKLKINNSNKVLDEQSISDFQKYCTKIKTNLYNGNEYLKKIDEINKNNNPTGWIQAVWSAGSFIMKNLMAGAISCIGNTIMRYGVVLLFG